MDINNEKTLKVCAEIRKKDWKLFLLLLFALLLALFMIFVILSNIVFSVKDLNHYLRNKENPIVVTATVTHYGTGEDGEGDRFYRSYISYTVNGIDYKNIPFQRSKSQLNLTEIGEQVTVEVSPEDPALLMKHLKNSADRLWLGIALLVCIFVSPWINYKRTPSL